MESFCLPSEAQLRGHLLQSLGRDFFSLTSADNCAAVFIAIKAEPDFQAKWNYSRLSHDNASFEWQLLMVGGVPSGFASVRILHFPVFWKRAKTIHRCPLKIWCVHAKRIVCVPWLGGKLLRHWWRDKVWWVRDRNLKEQLSLNFC